MSLTFGAATSDRVAVAPAASINALTAVSVLAWFYPTTLNNGRGVVDKASSPSKVGWTMGSKANGAVQAIMKRATTALFWESSSLLLTTNAWWLAAITINQTGPATHIYVGSLATLAAEATLTGADGSGAFGDDSAINLDLGNLSTLDSPVVGRVGVAAVFNRVLSLGEVQSWQFAPRMMAGCVGLWRLGDNGTGTQPDLSGNGNNGTVTGAIQSDNPPLRRWMMPRPRAPYRVPEVAPFGSHAPYPGMYPLARRR
jgi:hypothetical protein